MTRIRALARLIIPLGFALLLGGCLIGGGSSDVSNIGTRTYYRFNFTATLTTCVPTPFPPAGSTVSCRLQLPTGQSWAITVNLPGIAPASLPPLFDPLILQVPLSMGNFSGILTGPGGGLLSVTPVTGTLFADTNTPIVAEPGYQLVLVDFTPGAPLVSGATYAFQFDFYTDSPPPPQITVKILFTGKVTTGPAPTFGTNAEKAATTYYPPLLPCSANFAMIPGVDIVRGVPFNPLPLLTAQPCNNVTYDFAGGTPAATVTVVEYHHSGFDHYFITPVAAEIALLDAHAPPFQDWSRTGFSFNAYVNATAPTESVAICRFFNVSFAPKSSHFYAAHGFGCEDTLRLFPDWGLEDDKLFNTMLPDLTGACPAGTVPVYRLYNAGMGGAPNHRFVTSLAERQTMLNQGFVAEGNGIGVGMCAPP